MNSKSLLLILLTAVTILAFGDAKRIEGNYLKLSVVNNILNLGEIEPQDGAVIQYNAILVNIVSDVNWTLSIYAEEDLVNGKGQIIPLSNMSIGTVYRTFQQLETGNSTIIASGMPTDRDGEDIYLDFRLKLGTYNTAGDYSTRLSLELIPAF